jgi:murein DD-endopeptidase MepM/ murein hydrolase activator NlpD
MIHRFWAPAILLLWGAAAMAGEISLKGEYSQGGLVIGNAPPGSSVTLDGKSQPVAPDGAFLLGFGRDSALRRVLEVRLGGTRLFGRELAIKKRTYDVQRIDGLARRKVTPSPADLKRIKAEAAALRAARALLSNASFFRSGFVWPVLGRISGVYGSLRILNGKPRRPHYGVDVAAPEGTPVRAAAAGRIAFAHAGMFFNGKTVIIDHGLGLSTAYLHLSAITVTSGAAVKKGAMIGRIGKTGRATGAHLHWGMRLRATPVDPQLLVPAMK